MKTISLLFFGLFVITQIKLDAQATKFYSKNTNIVFDATTKTSPEKISGSTAKAATIVDLAAKKIDVSMLVKTFHFDKALMEEHFNENYMESDKFPKGVFKGTFETGSGFDINKEGVAEVKVKGDLTIHGITKNITTPAKLTIKSGKIVKAECSFNISLDDYGIKIPSLVNDKVNKTVSLQIKTDLEPLVK